MQFGLIYVTFAKKCRAGEKTPVAALADNENAAPSPLRRYVHTQPTPVQLSPLPHIHILALALLYNMDW